MYSGFPFRARNCRINKADGTADREIEEIKKLSKYTSFSYLCIGAAEEAWKFSGDAQTSSAVAR